MKTLNEKKREIERKIDEIHTYARTIKDCKTFRDPNYLEIHYKGLHLVVQNKDSATEINFCEPSVRVYSPSPPKTYKQKVFRKAMEKVKFFIENEDRYVTTPELKEFFKELESRNIDYHVRDDFGHFHFQIVRKECVINYTVEKANFNKHKEYFHRVILQKRRKRGYKNGQKRTNNS